MLTVVLIVRHPGPRFLHTTGVPHIYFPPYDRDQVIAILAKDPSPIFAQAMSPSAPSDKGTADEDDVWLWTRFCQAVWDSLAKGVARDLESFRSITAKLWRPFVQPVVDGTFGTRDFSRLIVAQRKLFQDETTLEDSILAANNETTSTVAHEVPYFAKWLLCAAYLASFNPARQDPIYFMKLAERKKRRKGGGAAGRPSKHRKIPRHLLSPGAFSLDRLMSILHAILPHEFTPTIDLYTQLSSLTSLRLLLKSGLFSADALEPGSRWKVTFGWDYVNKLAGSLNFDITDFVAE